MPLATACWFSVRCYVNSLQTSCFTQTSHAVAAQQQQPYVPHSTQITSHVRQIVANDGRRSYRFTCRFKKLQSFSYHHRNNFQLSPTDVLSQTWKCEISISLERFRDVSTLFLIQCPLVKEFRPFVFYSSLLPSCQPLPLQYPCNRALEMSIAYYRLLLVTRTYSSMHFVVGLLPLL